MQEIIKKNVIVCGTTFGQYYLKAIKSRPDVFCLKGILAGGSERSQKTAKEYETTLYTSVSELPEHIDFACVVIRSDGCGGNGTKIAVELMKRGISVIAEQPIHKAFLKDSYKAAVANKVCYQTGNFYACLPAVKCFLSAAKKMNETMTPIYIRASFSTQVSFPAMELLSEATGVREKIKVETLSTDNHPFQILAGKLGNIPMVMEFQNELCPSDPDAFMQLLHAFTLFYPSGRLELTDTMGSVVYRPRIYVPKDKYNGDLAGMEQQTEVVLFKKENRALIDEVEIEWTNAIAENLIHFSKRIEQFQETMKQDHRGAKEMLWADKWEELHEIFGFSRLMDCSDYQHFSVEDLKKE
ncbi:MAG: Gfo/Idh/MocA family oxidoreductase [Lachnospiraceae bacterium]|nr:Gfo/Idh/MocA family oxidoreductase [Lachnospiraceae bacterium]